MMLEWSAEHVTEIMTNLRELEFLPTSTNSGVRAAADAHSTRGSHEFSGERHCRQLAEEPVGGMARTAETL